MTAREANHRISNSLAMLSGLIAAKSKAASSEAELRAALGDTASAVAAIATLHRRLSSYETESVDLYPYLTDLCASLQKILPTRGGMDIDIVCADRTMAPAEAARTLGVLTAELATNSHKYAHPAGVPLRIDILLSTTDAGDIVFRFRDDGVGFPENFSPQSDGGIGLDLIHNLCDQLDGHYEWASSDVGLSFTLTFANASSDGMRHETFFRTASSVSG